MQYSHQTVVSAAVRHLQPDVPGVRNTGNASDRERYGGHVVPFGTEHVGQSESRTAVHGTLVDLRGYHQIVALPDTHRRHHIAGEYAIDLCFQSLFFFYYYYLKRTGIKIIVNSSNGNGFCFFFT